ncbi:putative RNA-directed DNA polymerase [Tanacetum coccineum]
MNEEMEALHKNETWEITNVPPGSKPIMWKWIYKTKYKSTEDTERFKARLVTKGYNQREGIDYDKIFSPMVKTITMRCLINIAVDKGWKWFQLDVNNAFLYGTLTEEVCMTLSRGYFSVNDKRVCKLKKSLYGVKQAPKQLNAKFCNTLLKHGFKQSKCHYSLFTKTENNSFLALLVFLDDIVVTGSNENERNQVKLFLQADFLIKDLGELKYFLGIEVPRTTNGICMSQRKYFLELLSENRLLACKPYNTPIEKKLILTNQPMNKKDKPIKNITKYQKLLRKLIYLTHTRPDIA